jgi:hypothetical protein
MRKDGAGYSSINVYYEDGYFNGYDTNKQGDAGKRGFDSQPSISTGAVKATKAFKLTMYDLVEMQYILALAKKVALENIDDEELEIKDKDLQSYDYDKKMELINKYKQ